MFRETFTSTSRGLYRDTVPMRLWEKAKKLGIWNPADIDYTKDAEDWNKLNEHEKRFILRGVSQFQAGEEAVTLDLLPLIRVIAQEGRLEEEMFLTTFLWEEAKHVDTFSRFFQEVIGEIPDQTHVQTPAYRKIFYDLLPKALNALDTDPSPAAQVKASVTYNMVVEGMLAETGYHVYFTIFDNHGIMPGLREGFSLAKLDESRHIAYGVFLISRLIAEDPSLMDVFQETMNELLPVGTELIAEIYEDFGDDVPFGLTPQHFIDYSQMQFNKRFARVQKSVGRSLEELHAVADLYMEDDEAAEPVPAK